MPLTSGSSIPGSRRGCRRSIFRPRTYLGSVLERSFSPSIARSTTSRRGNAIGPLRSFSMKMVNGSFVNALWVDRSRLPHTLEGTRLGSDLLWLFTPKRCMPPVSPARVPLQRSFAASVSNARDPTVGAGLAGPWGVRSCDGCHNTDACFRLGHVKDRDLRNRSACLPRDC